MAQILSSPGKSVNGLPTVDRHPTGRRSASSGCSRWLVSRLAGEHQRNLLFKTARWSETANGSLVLSGIGTTAERPTHAAKNQKGFVPALLRSAPGELLPS